MMMMMMMMMSLNDSSIKAESFCMGSDHGMVSGEQSGRSRQASYTIPAADTTEFATLSQKQLKFILLDS